ncbi:MAG: pyridoxamine 5'-phosphate oxidase family protein [Nocardioidaceae bacterium]|nr:hypothetical protein [Nocardioidaceae bacterium]
MDDCRPALARNLRSGRASFELDDFDHYTESGWSVLVRGDADHVEPANFSDVDGRPVAWAEGQRTFHVRITPHDITGRRLLPQ